MSSIAMTLPLVVTLGVFSRSASRRWRLLLVTRRLQRPPRLLGAVRRKHALRDIDDTWLWWEPVGSALSVALGHHGRAENVENLDVAELHDRAIEYDHE